MGDYVDTLMRAIPAAAYGRHVQWRWQASDAKDGVIALAITGFGIAGTIGAGQGEHSPRLVDAGAIALVVVAGLATAARHRAPTAVQLVVSAAVGIYLGLGYPYGPILAILTFVIGSAAALLEPRRSLLVTCASIVIAGAASLPRPELSWLWVAWFVAPWAIGALVRTRQESRRRAELEEASRRTYDERLRIAQEVHDVVGHGLSVIAMQAGVALHVLDRRPDEVRASLEAIRDTSTRSLDGLRATLALLRDETTAAELAPVSSLADIDRLVEGVRQGGLPVTVEVLGEPRPLPTAVDHAAYRIVQESLTNAVRHAYAGQVTVRLTYGGDALDVEVSDDGKGADAGLDGDGIAGMRERVLALAGTFAVGDAPGRGVVVTAQLPLRTRT